MVSEENEIKCCNGKYHIEMDGVFYCMAPENFKCAQCVKDVGKFTNGKKKILYCQHHQNPCPNCKQKKVGT